MKGDSVKKKKKKKRGHGEGSIYQRKNGLWAASIQIGTDESGKPIIKYFYSKEQKEVVNKLNEFKLLQAQGFDKLTSTTLKDYITSWLVNVKFYELKLSSYDRLESTINNQIIPRLGFYKLDVKNELTASIIQTELINKMFAEGYSHSSIKKAYNALNGCLKYASKNRQILFNPMETVVMPSETKFEKKEIKILIDDEIKRFEEACTVKHKNGELVFKIGYGFILILYTGIRMAEALALKWSDVDLENKTIKIDSSVVMVKNRKANDNAPKNILIEQDSTKTQKSKRTIKLCKKAYNSLVELNKIFNYDKDDYIFQTRNKTPIRPRNLQNTFDAILARANIEHKGVHSLRHTFASMLFKKKVDVKHVSEILGHADVRITYQTYIHLIQEQKDSAIDLLDED